MPTAQQHGEPPRPHAAHVSPPWLTAARAPKHEDARLAYGCYFLLGAGVLAPWNALLMAADYWAAVYPRRHVDRTFTVCYLPTCLLLIGAFIRFPKLLSHRARILTGFGGFFTLMLAVPMIDLIFVRDRSGEGPPAAYGLLLLTVLLVGVLDGISQGAIFGDASSLPGEYTHAVVGGTASSGALISLLRIATKASLPPTREGLRRSTAMYFGISAAVSLACFGVYSAVLPRLGVVTYWRRRRASAAGGGGAEDGAVTIGGSGGHGGTGTERAHSPWDEEPLIQQPDSHLEGRAPHPEPAGHSSPELGHHSAPLHWRACLASVWRLALAIVLVYVVTLAIFPGVLAEDSRSASLGDWYPLILMTLFNCSDLAGKNVPLPKALGARGHSGPLLWAAARALFLPLFVMATRLGAPAAVVGVLTVALGASNGYLTALTMTSAHDAAASAAAADMLENLMVFSLVLGLLLGALLGWCWVL